MKHIVETMLSVDKGLCNFKRRKTELWTGNKPPFRQLSFRRFRWPDLNWLPRPGLVESACRVRMRS